MRRVRQLSRIIENNRYLRATAKCITAIPKDRISTRESQSGSKKTEPIVLDLMVPLRSLIMKKFKLERAYKYSLKTFGFGEAGMFSFGGANTEQYCVSTLHCPNECNFLPYAVVINLNTIIWLKTLPTRNSSNDLAS